MSEEVKKKGMSKGCLIGLIVGGVLLLMIIIAVVTCYMKKDDLARFAATTVINGAKEMVAKEPIEGVDTVAFNSILDSFVKNLNEAPFDGEKYAVFFQKIQTIPADGKVDSVEIKMLYNAIIEYFPQLEELKPSEEIIDSTAIENTTQ